MNIYEAIKSQKKFKRVESRAVWMKANDKGIVYYSNPGMYISNPDPVSFSGKDLLEEYEIECEPEQKIELSWSEINKVLQGYYEVHGSFNSIKEKLGFKE